MQVQHGTTTTTTTTTTGTPRYNNHHLSFDLEGYHQQLYNQREQLRQFYQKQREHLRYENESEKQRRVFFLNNRACELVLSEDYSEANHLLETALMLQKEESSAAMQRAVVLSPRRQQHHRRQHSFESSTAAATATTTTTAPDCRCCFKDEHNDSCDCDEDQDLADDDGMDWGRKDNDAEDYYFDDDENYENYDHCIHFAGPSPPSSSSTPTTTVPYHDSNNYEATHHHLQSPPRSPAAAAATPPPAQATKDVLTASHASAAASLSPPRMTTTSRLRGLSYCGQQRYHETGGRNGDQQQHQQQRNHQVYRRPIVADEFVWGTAPSKDKSFVLIFNTALCNHLWGMRLMEECALLSATIRAAAVASAAPRGQPRHHNYEQAASAAALSDLAGHCYETLSVAKILYRLALENSVSFSHGVDKLAYVALYNNLSHLCKSLEGCETAGDSSSSEEALWCDEMLLKAVFWWRDSTSTTTTSNNNSSNNNNSNYHQALAHHRGRLGSSSNGNFTGTEARHDHNNSDEDDEEIVDAFLDNVFYRIGVTEEIAPAAAA